MARKLLWAAKIDFPQRSRSSTGNVRRAAAVSALMFGCTVLSQSAAPADSECKVTDFFVNELVPKLQSARAASTVVQIVHHAPPNASGGMPASVGADAAPARDEAQAIRLTIEQRDLNAFIRALPADADLRRVALLKSVALDHAFRNGALAIVRQILDWQPDALAERFPHSNRIAVEAVASEWSALQYFQRQGVPIANRPDDNDYLELLRILLKAGATPDGNLDGRPPLGIIATLPPTPATIAAAKLLLEAGANINAPWPDAVPPLVTAAESSNGEVARLMLATQHPDRESLDAALVKTPIVGTNLVLGLLLEAGADINTARSPTDDPRRVFTPALQAASRFKFNGERSVMQLMIRYRADPNRLPTQGKSDSPLTLVAPDVELMTGLLGLGADVNYRNLNGDTALLLAIGSPEAGAPTAHSDRYASIALLLGHGADASAENPAGVAPLKATGSTDTAVVSLLMAHGATWRLNDRDLSYYRQYQAPMGRYSWAVLNQKDALAAAMLAHGEGLSPEDCGILYYAAATGSDATLAALLKHHLGSYAVRADDRTPLMAAAAHGQLAAVRLLLDRHIASVDERTPRGVGLEGNGHGPPLPAPVGALSPLMIAAQMNRAAVAEELIRRGADINAHDTEGRTPLRYAQGAYAHEAITVLQAHGAKN
jgi:ankyrin repeat protein